MSPIADTVTLPLTGSGGTTAVVATDDAGAGGHVQIVKLALSADGSASPITADANGLKVNASGVAVPVTDNSGSLTVDAPVGTPVFVRLSDGSSAIATLPVSLASLPALAAGTNAIGKLAANSGVDIGDVTVDNAAGTNPLPVQGNVAHDGAAAGNPLLLAGQYKASPAKVSADGDVATLAVTQSGKLLFPAWTSAADTINDNNNYSSAQTNAALTNATAPGANKRLVIVEIMYSRDTAGNMKLVGDPAGTPATVFGPHYFPANGGMISTQCYIPLATNKALGITSVGGGNETITTRCIIENV